VPGLINAYKSATETALEQALIIEKHVEKRIFIEFDYTVLNEVMMVVRSLNLNIYHQEQLLFCRFDIGIKVEEEILALKMLTDIRGVSVVN
jgi:putative IMPACT (imprinted ancient) family translation regulator